MSDAPSVACFCGSRSSPASRGRWPGGPEGAGRSLAVAALVLLLAFVGAASALAAPTFPRLTGRVVDDAHVLSPQIQADLDGKLAKLEADTGDQLVVVTLPSLQGYPIEDYGYQLGRAWGIGQKGKDNGVLFIIAPSEHKVRIEVGYGLEPVLTDALSSVILQGKVLPKFRDGDMSGGIVAGTDALLEQLSLPPDQAKARAEQARAPAKGRGSPVGAIIMMIVLFWVLASIAHSGRRGLGGGSAWWLLPLIMSSGGRRGGWGGGGGGGGLAAAAGSAAAEAPSGAAAPRGAGDMLLRPDDHERITAAIKAAEARTSGEIFPVVARECSDYWEIPLIWAIGAALVAPAVALFVGFHPSMLARVSGTWTAAHATSVDVAVSQALIAYVTVQAALFVAVELFVSIPLVRRLLTPSSLKRARVRRLAEEQFAARGLAGTRKRTGVLIFASLAERRAEVVVDSGIADKVPTERWAEVVAALVAGMARRDPGAGFAAAIGKAGDILEPLVPRRPDDVNELPDVILELE